MSTRLETNHKIQWYHFILQYMPQDGSIAFENKKRSCPFLSAKLTARRKKPKKLFSLDQPENLVESNKGSYFDQEQWLKELNKQPSTECDPSISTSTLSASQLRLKSLLQIWKAKTLKHGKGSMVMLSQLVNECRRRSMNQ